MGKPKLHVYIPSLPQKSYEYRRGDSIAIYDDNQNIILIDGGEGDLFTRMETFLKTMKRSDGYAHVCFVLTHWHADHDNGLKNALNSPHIFVDEIYCPPPEELKDVPKDEGLDEYKRAVKILGLAKDLNKKIIYPAANKKVGHWVGKIRMWMYRQAASSKDYVDYQVNNTSIQTYFPDLEFLTGGDMINSDRFLKRFPSWRITGFKIWHHGNACGWSACDLLKEMGAKICYYTDWEPSGIQIGCTRFSQYGAGRTKQYFTTLRPFEDITIDADGEGHLAWTQGTNVYKYDIGYGRTEDTTPAQDPEPAPAQDTPKLRDMSTLFGVDVAYCQGKIDWDKAANEIDFAILQAGYGQDRTSQDDKQFARNAAECERLGIPYGIYLYSYAKNTTAAGGEADHILRLAKGKQLSLPIYYDLEESSLGNVAAGNMIVFGGKVEAAGYHCGVYSGEYYYNKNLGNVNSYTKWIARYNSNNGKQGTKPNVSNVVIWQYSSKGKVSGISGNVDINVMYGDDLIKSVTGKDYIQAARDVWAGKYGTEPERPEKLKAAGYDPRIVQHFVNRLIK